MPRTSKSWVPPFSEPEVTRSSTAFWTSCMPKPPTPCCSERCQSIPPSRNYCQPCSAISNRCERKRQVNYPILAQDGSRAEILQRPEACGGGRVVFHK